MFNSNVPTDHELPSTKKLLKSTILAAIVAGVLLVTVVMPAEYGIDPTGIGNAIGLKRMGEIKVSLAKEAAADQAADSKTVLSQPPAAAAPASPQSPATALKSDKTMITLAPDQGTEIKVTMNKGEKVQYTWSTDGGRASYDAHGDSAALGINYHSYGKGSDETKKGEIEAAFDGSHGWFWRNRNAKPMTITLHTSGQYTEIKRF